MRNTRKKILAMILALVMAMSITASAGYITPMTVDVGPADKNDYYAYTNENCKGAIRRVYADANNAYMNPDGSYIDGHIPEPSGPYVDELSNANYFPSGELPADYKGKDGPYVLRETAIGNARETWDYLAENFTAKLADTWFRAESNDFIFDNDFFEKKDREPFVMLNWLLSGDADRLFAYVYNYSGFDEADHWLFTYAIGNTPMLTDKYVLHDRPIKQTVTTPEPTTTQPVTNTNTAPVTVTPGEVVTVTVNGVPMQLEAVVIKDANGGATTYFKLRDVGDAVGFQVDWSASTGITVNSK